MGKALKLDFHGKTYNLRIKRNVYTNNKNLCLTLVDNRYEEDFARITTNITMLPYGMAAVDTNNCPWAEDFIKSNMLGRDTGTKIKSGYCTYPVYEFDIKVIDEYGCP